MVSRIPVYLWSSENSRITGSCHQISQDVQGRPSVSSWLPATLLIPLSQRRRQRLCTYTLATSSMLKSWYRTWEPWEPTGLLRQRSERGKQHDDVDHASLGPKEAPLAYFVSRVVTDQSVNTQAGTITALVRLPVNMQDVYAYLVLKSARFARGRCACQTARCLLLNTRPRANDARIESQEKGAQNASADTSRSLTLRACGYSSADRNSVTSRSLTAYIAFATTYSASIGQVLRSLAMQCLRKNFRLSQTPPGSLLAQRTSGMHLHSATALPEVCQIISSKWKTWRYCTTGSPKLAVVSWIHMTLTTTGTQSSHRLGSNTSM